MNVGFMGLGKLGLPCALAIEDKGHTVYGYEINEEVLRNIRKKKITYLEEGAQELLNKSKKLFLTDLADMVRNSDIIFVPIQTPHRPEFEGCTRLPEERVDFDYTWLEKGIEDLAAEIERQSEPGESKVVVIISTVLPGTIEERIKPLLNKHVKLCYNPFFIAMGTCIEDFMNPEFVLFGVDDEEAAKKAERFYRTLHDSPFCKMSVASAELAKVAYNTYIGQKITFINTMMEICHHIPGANVDDISRAIKLANKRLISTAYLNGGMGDGGGCHPRDNIALSWLARKLNLSYDLFDSMMTCREKQTEWLADLVMERKNKTGLPVVILGKAFKPMTNITTGSPAILLYNILKERTGAIHSWDPYVDTDPDPWFLRKPAVYFIGTMHENFKEHKFPRGSVVIDPWRYINKQDGVELIRLGE